MTDDGGELLVLAVTRKKKETERDIVNCESDPCKLGSLYVYPYSPYSMRTIHYVLLGPPQRRFMAASNWPAAIWKRFMESRRTQ